MQKSESIAALGAALAVAQGLIKGAAKDSANPFFNSKYADLSAVWDACRGPLSANGLAVVQLPATKITENDLEVIVTTILAHSSGEWISEELSAIPAKSDPQGIGSCITYLRRYALAAVAGVAPEDDDGNAASTPGQPAKPQKRAATASASASKALPESSTAEIEALYAAIKNAGKVLNELGDETEWNLKSANTFANENFNTKDGVQGLTVPQLTEMSKLLSARINSLKKPKPPKVSDLMVKVLSNFKDADEFGEYLKEKKYPASDKLTDVHLATILADVEVPF